MPFRSEYLNEEKGWKIPAGELLCRRCRFLAAAGDIELQYQWRQVQVKPSVEEKRLALLTKSVKCVVKAIFPNAGEEDINILLDKSFSTLIGDKVLQKFSFSNFGFKIVFISPSWY